MFEIVFNEQIKPIAVSEEEWEPIKVEFKSRESLVIFAAPTSSNPLRMTDAQFA